MIVIDTSALMAIFEGEAERHRFISAIALADRRVLSAVTLLEASMVARGRRGTAGLAEMQAIIRAADMEILAFDAKQAALALDAFQRYGKALNPKARLNLGDCCSYALAKSLDAPLLFKGDDFSETDVIAAT